MVVKQPELHRILEHTDGDCLYLEICKGLLRAVIRVRKVGEKIHIPV